MCDDIKDVYDVIINHMSKRKSDGCLALRTRDVADATNVSTYQARYYLELLCAVRVVEKIESGKGTVALWTLL